GAYLQDDGIHPNAEGVALNVAAIGPKVQQLIDQVAQ
ncbi:MAG: arylesterase, partial [Pseudomonadota bacterium]|nr:arylesterase [Pseudomonadota bacterium]MEC8573046.1 arylesterase [Pseudomonadota bacterium]